MNIFDKKKYHFIGIGGIGISAIARMLVLQGKKVSGSDSAKSEITDDLEKIGVKIYIGQRAENIAPDTEVVIYTIAIPDTNPEMREAMKKAGGAKSATERTSAVQRGQESEIATFASPNLLCLSYPEALGELSRQKYTIAISGTHGKTTTTAMIAHIMEKAGLDPTVIIGSKMLSGDGDSAQTNFHAGKSKYLVAEACEYRRSFLNLSPTILVITNIEPDHLDYYKDFDDIKSAFEELKAKVPENGFVVDENEYSKITQTFPLPMAGEHNMKNARAAICAVSKIGVSVEKAIKYLQDFRGTWRRLEYKGSISNKDGEQNSMIFYDDYAHHPTAIEATLRALREKYPDHTLIAVFEPHQQKRTKDFFDQFVTSLSLADLAFIAPIYMAREEKDPSISNTILADTINKNIPAKPIANVDELKAYLDRIDNSKPICVAMMGAGDIYKYTQALLSKTS